MLQNKKIHVEASLLNQTKFGSKEAFPHPAGRRTAPYNNYEEYLFDPQNGQQGAGFSGIFRVQTKERNGTVYTDIGLKFSPAYKVNGEQVDAATTVKAEPKQEKKPEKPRAATPKKKGRKSRSKTGKKGGVSKEKFEGQKKEQPVSSTEITNDRSQAAKMIYESLMATGQTSQTEALNQARSVDPNFAPKLGTKKSKVLDREEVRGMAEEERHTSRVVRHSTEAGWCILARLLPERSSISVDQWCCRYRVPRGIPLCSDHL